MLDSCGIPEGLIGPPSLEPVKVNGHLCDALLDSGSRVSIIFESWYRRYLSDTQIHPVKKLDIWGMGDSSYPYLGYVVVDLEFPKKVAGTPTAMSALALICPDPPGPDQTPVLIGTNTKASFAKRLAQLCEDTTGVFVAHTFGIRNTCTQKEKEMRTTELKGEEDDEVGCVKWEGPGPLTLPAGSSGKVICKVEIKQPLPNEILMVKASLTNPLPAGVLLQPMVIPSIAVDVNQFIVLVQNESLKDATIPVGTVLGHLSVTDVVTTASKQQPLKPQSGKGKLKTLHRDNLLPIGDLVRIPAIDNTEDVPTRPATRANGHKRHKRAKTDHPIQLEGEMSTEASDLECDWPHRPYRTYMEKIIQRQEENNTDRAEQPGVRIPEKDSCPKTENSPLEDQDPDTAPETDSGPQSSDSSEEDDRQQSSRPNIVVTPRQARPKRLLKPVVRLTYDKPGKARDEPIIIVHRGVTIKIGKS
ncbi:Protein unc-79 like [Dissostichus eleginoides]|uniref:Protein unc-79 like n=1 Tax=Dissostichus eleginoides TaxID=100907 RepID=A0AAD9BCL6_DISEL|nr:Protein unc-79 like [Dissostichus eleginoides]